MWRERVYNGTLRQPLDISPAITGTYLCNLLNALARSVHNSNSTQFSSDHDVNFVDNGVYLGDKYTAKDRNFLMKHGFTHVLNAAEGTDEYQVNTGANYYKGTRIQYFGVPGHDRPSWNIGLYLEQAAKFIHHAVIVGGKVLVHCVVGISRSATLVIAYLMIYKGLNAAEALTFTFKKRRVFPNNGFLHSLAHLNTKLMQSSIYPSTSAQFPSPSKAITPRTTPTNYREYNIPVKIERASNQSIFPNTRMY